jgi:hypothetical protein
MSEPITFGIVEHRPSESDPALTYTLHRLGDQATCSCLGWTTHGRCKHVDALLKERQMTDENGQNTAVAVREDSGPPEPMALTIPARSLPTEQELRVMSKIALVLVKARGHSVPKEIDSPSKAAAVLLAGWELGVKPMTAFRHIFVVNGRTEPDSQVMMGLVRAKDATAEFIFHEYTEERCEVELRRRGKSVVTVTYTIEDARRSGQLKKEDTWGKYPRDMLAWAAVKRACRLGAPDLINAIPSIDVGAAGDLLLASGEMPAPGIEEVEEEQAAEEMAEVGHAEPQDEDPPLRPADVIGVLNSQPGDPLPTLLDDEDPRGDPMQVLPEDGA